MKYIVFDLEWNQCPDGKEREIKHFPFEIFEIGAVKLDEDKNIIDEFSCYIKLQVYKQLHYIIKGMTHVAMDKLDSGMVFPDAVRAFFEWCASTGEYMMCTWGSSDLVELQRNMRYWNVDSPLPFPLLYYDVQKLYSIQYEDGKNRRSLEIVVDALNIQKEWEFHSALADARYTGIVLGMIDMERVGQFVSVDCYKVPIKKKDEINLNFGNYTKYISMAFDTKEEAMENSRLLHTNCVICGKPARKKIRWFTVNSKMHFCLCFCREHGYMKGRFRVKEDEFGKYYAVKILKMTDEKGAEKIKERQLEMRKKRYDKRHRQV